MTISAMVLSACAPSSAPMVTVCAGSGCVRTGTPSSMLAAEVVPQSGSPLVQQEFSSVVFSSDGQASLPLGLAHAVDGQVRDGLTRDPTTAQIVFTRPSKIPGRGLVVTEASTDSMGLFKLSLPAGDHLLRILPQSPVDADFPPMSLKVPVTGDMPLGMLVLERGAEIDGAVVSALAVGLGGVKVRAVDPVSGDLLSSLATTKADGSFTLWLSPTSPDVALPAQVTLVADGTQALLGALIDLSGTPGFPSLIISRNASSKGNAGGAPLELRVPAFAVPQAFVLPLTGTSSSGAVIPVEEGARVVFATQLGTAAADTQATYTVTPSTDGTGRAMAALIPGSDSNLAYSITVNPVSDSAFAAVTWPSFPIGNRGGVLGTQTLPSRLSVYGRVLSPSPDDQPIAGLVVSLQPTAGTTKPATGATLPTQSTDDNGSFVLRVDPASGAPALYDLYLVPPPMLPLARWSDDGRSVTDQDLDLGDLVSPAAVATRLQIIDAAGSPVGGADVRLYTVSCDAGDTACTTAPRLRGEGTTNADTGSASLGQVSILIADAASN